MGLRNFPGTLLLSLLIFILRSDFEGGRKWVLQTLFFFYPQLEILRNFNISLCPTVQFLKWAERSFQWEIIRTCSIYHQQLSTNLSITSRSNETWNFETTPKKILNFSQWGFYLYALAFPLSFVNKIFIYGFHLLTWFLWNRNWDLRWIWAGWHYWKKNIWADYEQLLRPVFMGKKQTL